MLVLAGVGGGGYGSGSENVSERQRTFDLPWSVSRPGSFYHHVEPPLCRSGHVEGRDLHFYVVKMNCYHLQLKKTIFHQATLAGSE